MAEFYFDNLAKNLPDAYKKHAQFKCSSCGNVWISTNRKCPRCGADDCEIVKEKTSNNFKILEIERIANNDLRTVISDIENILDINNATGATLDMYGKKYGQARGKTTDAQYRIMIKSKINRSWCNGSYKNIVDAIAQTFNCSADDILISETDVMTVSLDKIPMASIIQAGFSTSQAELIIRNLLPVGVMLASVLFEGTFEFGEGSLECPVCGEIITEGKYCPTCSVQGKIILTEKDYDENAGFSEAENGKIGGYLGWTGSQESIDELPI